MSAGTPGNIVLYGRENSSGTYVYFKEHVLANKDFPAKYQALPGTGAVVDAVAKDKGGIGYGGIGYATDHQDRTYHKGSWEHADRAHAWRTF